MRGAVYALEEWRAKLDPTEDLPFAVAHATDHVTVLLYAPRDPDRQTPHAQDELYVVAAGHGTLWVAGEPLVLQTGDTALVPAHAEHRFADVTPDFVVWAVFFGPPVPAPD